MLEVESGLASRIRTGPWAETMAANSTSSRACINENRVCENGGDENVRRAQSTSGGRRLGSPGDEYSSKARWPGEPEGTRALPALDFRGATLSRKQTGCRKPRGRQPTACGGCSKELCAKHLRLSYGMSLDDYYTLLKEQKGVCAICKRPNRNGARLCVDHDHRTGVVRGLLCTQCNAILGYIDDSPIILKGAIKYLENTGREREAE